MKLIKFLFLVIILCCMVGEVEAKEKKYKNGDFYTGEWKNGKPEGRGKMVFANGFIYDGLWENGQIVGDGNVEGPKVKFEGLFTPIYDNDVLVAIKPLKGILVRDEGGTFEGEWQDNMFDGTLSGKDYKFKGIIDYNNNVLKKGRIDFRDGGFIEGTMLLTSDFEGNVEKAQLPETYLLYGPAVYSGVFANGEFVGHISGSNYSDEVDKFDIDVEEDGSQYGVLILKNGGKYEGYLNNMKYSGEGTLTIENGIFSGLWAGGQLWNGNIKQWDTNGNAYSFITKQGTPTYYLENGDSFTLTGTLDGKTQLYPQVIKFMEGYGELQRQRAIKKQQEEERLAQAEAEAKRIEAIEKRKEEERLAAEKAAKEIASKYGGMVFQGEGSLFALLDDDATGFLGLLLGAKMTQTLRVSFLPDGKVNVREIDTNVKAEGYGRMTESQWLAMAMNSSGGTTYTPTLQGNKVVLSNNLYMVISNDKKSLKIFGLSASYTLKRKLK